MQAVYLEGDPRKREVLWREWAKKTRKSQYKGTSFTRRGAGVLILLKTSEKYIESLSSRGQQGEYLHQRQPPTDERLPLLTLPHFPGFPELQCRYPEDAASLGKPRWGEKLKCEALEARYSQPAVSHRTVPSSNGWNQGEARRCEDTGGFEYSSPRPLELKELRKLLDQGMKSIPCRNSWCP